MARKQGITLSGVKDMYMLTRGYINLSPSSKRIYEQNFNYAQEFMDMQVQKINRVMILDFRDKNYDHKAKCRGAIEALKLLMQFAFDRGLCAGNPAKDIRHMPPKEGWKRWTTEELNKVLDVAPPHLRNIIVLAVYTGQRRSDLIRMRWDNYDGTYIHIIQQKTKKPLAIPVHPILKTELERMRSERRTECSYILTNTLGWQWAADSATTAITRLARSVGVEKVIHGLRKTTASVLAELGCTPFEVAAITGQSLKEVMHYTMEVDRRKLADSAIEKWARQYQ